MSESRDVITKVLDCCLEVTEFEQQSCYYVYFQTNICKKDTTRTPIPLAKQLISFK